MKTIKRVHSETEYHTIDGTSIHSDVCPPNCDFDAIDKEYRVLLHKILDDWIDNSCGTGGFYIRAASHKFDDTNND